MKALDILEHARRLQFLLGIGCRRSELHQTPVGILPDFGEGPEATRRWEELMVPHMEAVQRSLPEHDLGIDPPDELAHR